MSPRDLNIAEQKWVDKLVSMRPFGLKGAGGSSSRFPRNRLFS